MTDFQITADHLSRGKAYWNIQSRRLLRTFSRTQGDARLQAILDMVRIAREIAAMCPTYSPCSRECVLRGESPSSPCSNKGPNHEAR